MSIVLLQQKEKHEEIKRLKPPFGKCLFSQIGINAHQKENRIRLTQDVENHNICLSKMELPSLNNESYILPIGHASKCPTRIFQEAIQSQQNHHHHNNNNQHSELINYKNENEQKQKIKIGVAMIIEDSKGEHVLLTRRAAHMRTFPSTWVVPGGHLEPGETLFEGAAREVREETSVEIPPDSLSLVALWESVYCKHSLDSIPLPMRQHLVVYGKAKLPSTPASSFSSLSLEQSSSLTSSSKNDDENKNQQRMFLLDMITMQESEVGAAAWVPKSVLKSIVQPYISLYDSKIMVDGNSFPGVEYNEHGKLCHTQFSLSDLEGNIALGTQFALRKFLEN